MLFKAHSFWFRRSSAAIFEKMTLSKTILPISHLLRIVIWSRFEYKLTLDLIKYTLNLINFASNLTFIGFEFNCVERGSFTAILRFAQPN